MDKHVEVLIIGSGAGGGTLARCLAEAGREVLVLERGDWLPREPQNWEPEAVFQQGRYVSSDLWKDKHGKTFQPGSHYFVGGASKMYGAAHFRFRARDFEEMVHVDGLSPAWPVRYGDFEPYYTKAEAMYHVHGLRGEDPTEPPASGPYPHPPVAHEPRMQQLVDVFSQAGLHPFHMPVGVNLTENDLPQSACVKCNRCDGYPCVLTAKGDGEAMGIRPALAAAGSRMSLLTRSMVKQLKTDASGRRIASVLVERDGELLEFSADLVVISCGAANSAKLLLMSANDHHPRGLANSSAQVGRNYMFHYSKAVVAVTHEPNPTVFQKTPAVNDWYFGDANFDFPMGHVQLTGKTNGAMMKGYKPRLTALAPSWSMDKIAAHSMDFWLQTEDLPLAQNRVTVDGQGQITLNYTATNVRASAELQHRLESVLDKNYGIHHFAEREVYFGSAMGIEAVGHQAGTCRFGDDPRTSVLDVNCKAHDLDNLYVVDTSFMPSISAVNPSLTAIANAIRVSEHLVERLG